MVKANSRWRGQITLQLHAQRARLLQVISGVEAQPLEQLPLWEDWTVSALLPHIALCDAFEARRLQLASEGRISEIKPIDVEKQNANWHRRYRETALETGLAMMLKERNGLLNVINTMPDQLLQATLTVTKEFQLPLIRSINNSIEHDQEHGEQIRAWRKANSLTTVAHGPPPILSAYLRAGRRALRALVALVDDPQQPLNDGWSLHAMLSHLAGWERFALEGLIARRSPPIADFDEINAANVTARRDQSFEAVWNEYSDAREQMLDIVQAMDATELAQPLADHWEGMDSLYRWVHGFVGHELYHVNLAHDDWLVSRRRR